MSPSSAASVIFLLAAASFYETECLSCYECSVPRPQEGEKQDLTCVHAPSDIPGSLKTCLPHLKACKTVRIEHKDSGRLDSFVRGCSSPGEDNIEENYKYIIYSQFCFTNKCNTGNGIDDGKDPHKKRIVAILIKDIQNAGNRIPSKFFLLIFAIFLSLF